MIEWCPHVFVDTRFMIDLLGWFYRYLYLESSMEREATMSWDSLSHQQTNRCLPLGKWELEITQGGWGVGCWWCNSVRLGPESWSRASRIWEAEIGKWGQSDHAGSKPEQIRKIICLPNSPSARPPACGLRHWIKSKIFNKPSDFVKKIAINIINDSYLFYYCSELKSD